MRKMNTRKLNLYVFHVRALSVLNGEPTNAHSEVSTIALIAECSSGTSHKIARMVLLVFSSKM